jgi:hypothetical protein
MADRMPQFPMHPNAFGQPNMARPPQQMMLGQQGQQALPPQDNQALAGGPPDSRNWAAALASQQQMLQQLAHMQQRQPTDLAGAGASNLSQQQVRLRSGRPRLLT